MNIRKAWLGLIASGVLAGVASCGGGGGDSGGAATYTVGGTIAGSAGVVLRLNGASDLPVSALGNFTFSGGLANGTAYTVTVATAAQPCTVANGTGTMGATNITNVTITCTTVVRSASLTGAQETPPTGATGIGRGAVVVNPTTKEITGGITFSGLTTSPPTAQHIHLAPAGNPTGSGPPIITLTLAPNNSTATVPAGTVLSDTQYTAFLAGELYFNVHTTANINGEIRGQINGPAGGVTAGLASLSGASEVPANASTATGRGTIVFDSATRDILIAYATHSVAGATVSHIHTGAPGVSGPPNVVTLSAAGATAYTAPNPTTLTTQNVTDLNAGNTYFNVHSGTYGAGEIRGQIAVQ